MKGHPKYKIGDEVSFYNSSDVGSRDRDFFIKAGKIEGRVEIVDAYGAIGCNDVSYDIYDKEHNMLWKHVEEKDVKRIKREK